MKKSLIICVLFLFLACGSDNKTELDNVSVDISVEQVAKEFESRFAKECNAKIRPLVDELNKGTSIGDVKFASELRNDMVQVYEICIKINDELVARTYADFGKNDNNQTCIKNADEALEALSVIKANLQILKSANLSIKEERIEAYSMALLRALI